MLYDSCITCSEGAHSPQSVRCCRPPSRGQRGSAGTGLRRGQRAPGPLSGRGLCFPGDFSAQGLHRAWGGGALPHQKPHELQPQHTSPCVARPPLPEGREVSWLPPPPARPSSPLPLGVCTVPGGGAREGQGCSPGGDRDCHQAIVITPPPSTALAHDGCLANMGGVPGWVDGRMDRWVGG